MKPSEAMTLILLRAHAAGRLKPEFQAMNGGELIEHAAKKFAKFDGETSEKSSETER